MLPGLIILLAYLPPIDVWLPKHEVAAILRKQSAADTQALNELAANATAARIFAVGENGMPSREELRLQKLADESEHVWEIWMTLENMTCPKLPSMGLSPHRYVPVLVELVGERNCREGRYPWPLSMR